MQTPEQFRTQLEAQRHRTQMIYLVHTAAYAIAIVLLALRIYVPAMVLGIGNLMLHFLFMRKLLIRYSQAVTNANLLCGLCQGLEDPCCTEGSGMPDAEFEALKLLPLRQGKGSSLMTHNGFAGKMGDLSVKGYEATLHYPYVKNNGKTDYHFLNGTLLVSRGEKKDGARWLLLHKSLLEKKAEQLFLEANGYRNIAFSAYGLDDFQLYTTQESATVPKALCQHLELLARGAKSLGAVGLGGDFCAVFLVNRFYTRRVKVRELPDVPALCANPLPERDAVLALMRWWHKQ